MKHCRSGFPARAVRRAPPILVCLRHRFAGNDQDVCSCHLDNSLNLIEHNELTTSISNEAVIGTKNEEKSLSNIRISSRAFGMPHSK